MSNREWPETKKFDFTHLAIMSVGIGVNPEGGGAPAGGDGGRTVFELSIDGGSVEVEADDHSIRLKLGGNSEAHGLLQCLRFAVAELESKLKE